MKDLITFDNAKTTKGESLGWLTGILYLAPYTLSGRNVCSHASPHCAEDCLNLSGMGVFDNVQQARIRKTQLFHASPKAFVEGLDGDIGRARRKADRMTLRLALRLNGLSDLPWENLGGERKVSLMERHPDLTFYDYTKNPHRMAAYLDGKMPENYKLTFSRSEVNEDIADAFVRRGGNVAAVFSTKKKDTLPDSYLGAPVIDGDTHDLRFLDPRGVVVGLRAKGKARNNQSDFVIAV
jgi:hypothetical protein